MVTRSADRAGDLSALLRKRGAVPIEAPAIVIEPVPPRGRLDAAIREAADGRYAWVVFTSAAGADAWFDRARALRVRELRAKVAAVGSGTAEALKARRVKADLVPRTYTTAALGRAFPRGSGKVLLPRADIAPPGLEEALRKKGWTPVRVKAYRSRRPRSLPPEARQALREGRVDAVTFTSASTVEGFSRLVRDLGGPKVACIGPVTSKAAREAGYRVAAVARPHTMKGLVAAVERALKD